jgi:ssDNA-binding Zn-finger/Zn-ribbon topoisomerase 1
MKNIHVLPTNKPSRVFNTNKGEYHFREHYVPDTIQTCKNHNIYITSDEEIKEKDWCYYENGDLKGIHKVVNGQRPKTMILKKIILTTDQDLINDGVQAIDDEFLEWFVKNPSCEEVEVKRNYLGSKCLKCGFIENHDEVDTEDCPKCHNTTYEHLYNNKIIITKEEPK